MPVSPRHSGSLAARFPVARRPRGDRWVTWVVTAAAVLVLACLAVIPLFLAGSLLIRDTGAPDWSRLGLLAMDGLRATVCAMLVALPLGFAAAGVNGLAARRLRGVLRGLFELFGAVPTVVLGLIAVAALAPWLARHVASLLAVLVAIPAVLMAAGFAFGVSERGARWRVAWMAPLVVALAAAGLMLADRTDVILIRPGSPWNAILVGFALGLAAVPVVFSIADDALAQVPGSRVDAALALGATRWQAFATIAVPAAAPGLAAAAMLGFSRCFGETMIVLMASGNTLVGGFDPTRGLRAPGAELALGMPDASVRGADWHDLLLAALLLFVVAVAIHLAADVLRGRLRRRGEARQ